MHEKSVAPQVVVPKEQRRKIVDLHCEFQELKTLPHPSSLQSTITIFLPSELLSYQQHDFLENSSARIYQPKASFSLASLSNTFLGKIAPNTPFRQAARNFLTVKTSLTLLLPDGDFHFSLKDTQFPQSSSIPGNNMADTFLNLKGKKATTKPLKDSPFSISTECF